MALKAGTGEFVTTESPGSDKGAVAFMKEATHTYSGANSENDIYAQQAFALNTSNPILGKAGGLGDLELVSPAAPIEIGNRVWLDANNNGIQDANEAGIPNVQVQLVSGGTTVATATTAADGTYYFSNATGTSTTSKLYGISQLQPNTAYTIHFPTTVTVSSANYSLTSANAGSNTAIDSNALATGDVAVATTDIPVAGANNHSFDVGYAAAPTTGSLNISKAVLGGTDPQSFTLQLDCSDNTFDNPSITLANGATYTVTGISTGTTCTVTESTPAAPVNYTYAAPIITPSQPVTIAANQTTSISVMNPLSVTCANPSTPSLNIGNIAFAPGVAPNSETVTTNGSNPLPESNVAGFHSSTSSEGAFYSFCTEISQPILPLQNPYTHEANGTANGFSTTVAHRIAQVVEASGYNPITGFGSGNNTVTNFVALQLAVWNAVYDTDYSVTAGNFQSFTENNAGARTLANAWLAAAQNIATPSVVVHNLHNATGQDLLMVGAVPTTCPTCTLSTPTVTTSCNNNGTANDPTDDKFTYQINVTGTGVGSTYSISGSDTQAGLSYATNHVSVNSFPISAGNLTLTLTDDTTASCSLNNVVVTPPATCSSGTPNADLELSKTVDKSTVNSGDTVNYTLTVTNKGPDAATGVVVTDKLPVGLTYVSDNGQSTYGADVYDEATGLWSVGILANGVSKSLVITATVN